jgi:hypothetical protein
MQLKIITEQDYMHQIIINNIQLKKFHQEFIIYFSNSTRRILVIGSNNIYLKFFKVVRNIYEYC